jgi:hypothetical protein
MEKKKKKGKETGMFGLNRSNGLISQVSNGLISQVSSRRSGTCAPHLGAHGFCVVIST